MARVYDFDDAVFNAGLIHTAEVRFDANAAGDRAGGLDGYASVRYDPQPVPGYEALPCRCIPKAAVPTSDDKPGAAVAWKVMYADPVRLTVGHRLVYVDRAGAVHRLDVAAASVDAHEMRHHCSVLCTEQVV